MLLLNFLGFYFIIAFAPLIIVKKQGRNVNHQREMKSSKQERIERIVKLKDGDNVKGSDMTEK